MPVASSAAALKRMKNARQRDTVPELAIRARLFRMGLRYRVDRKPIAELPRRADIVFGSAKVAVYINGCFWHGCPVHGTWPKKNAEFWRSKIEANQTRDMDTDRRLIEAGWMAVRIWEHEDPVDAATRIADLVRHRRAACCE